MPFSHIFFFSKRFWYGWGDGEVQLRDFVLKGANLQPSTNTYTRKKSMGDNSDNFCEFLNGYVRNHFSWSNNFPFGQGITLNWSKTPSECRNVRKQLFFKQLYLGN